MPESPLPTMTISKCSGVMISRLYPTGASGASVAAAQCAMRATTAATSSAEVINTMSGAFEQLQSGARHFRHKPLSMQRGIEDAVVGPVQDANRHCEILVAGRHAGKVLLASRYVPRRADE